MWYITLMYPCRNQQHRWGHTSWAPGSVSTPQSLSGILRLLVISCDTTSGLETRESLQTPSVCQTDAGFGKVTFSSQNTNLKKGRSILVYRTPLTGLEKWKCVYVFSLTVCYVVSCIVYVPCIRIVYLYVVFYLGGLWKREEKGSLLSMDLPCLNTCSTEWIKTLYNIQQKSNCGSIVL